MQNDDHSFDNKIFKPDERGLAISVVVPTCNAARWIGELLQQLNRQTRSPDEILVVDSASEDATVEIARSFPNVHIIEIDRACFDHGATRDMALRESAGDVIFFLTQDAVLSNERYIEEMLGALSQPDVACVCGRQTARDDAPLYEKLTREFNYPNRSSVRGAEAIETMGIKAFFLSDVCSAYRRDAYLAVGGFDYPIATNEDMLIAAKFLRAGYKIAYCASAVVVHSHAFTLQEEYLRNYKIGLTLEQYRERLAHVSASREGLRLVRYVLSGLLKQGAFLQCIRFCLLCAAKWAGNRAGKRFQRKAEPRRTVFI